MPGAAAAAGPPERLVEQVVAVIRAERLARRRARNWQPGSARADVAAACRVAERRGLLVAVERDRWVAAEALDEFSAVLGELDRSSAGDGGITVAMVRERIGLSRKYLIPALEWADRSGVTRRSGDVRHLVRRSA